MSTTHHAIQPAPKPAPKWVAWVSSLLKSVWTFFPALLFIFLVILCFWTLDQGKDILVAYMEKGNRLYLGGATRSVFFISIGFWVYITWYSSRIIAYIKERQQQDLLKKASGQSQEEAEAAYKNDSDFFDIKQYFLDNFPRVAGNACLLVLELAILQSPALHTPIGPKVATILFFAMMVLLFLSNGVIRDRLSVKDKPFRTAFWVSLTVFLLLMVVAAFPSRNMTVNACFSLGVLIVLHVIYLLYVNLRKREMAIDRPAAREQADSENRLTRTMLHKIMDYFCIPRVESGYFRYFLLLVVIGLIIDWAAIIYLPFARGITPFPMVILGFSVLLAIGNVITALSVRYRINFHILILIAAFFISRKENHFVKVLSLADGNNGYLTRPDLRAYLTAWLNDRVPVKDAATTPYDVYFVLSNGGASRSGFWTASVLGALEDSFHVKEEGDRFSRHVFCLSGTSGGGVGVAAFFGMLKEPRVAGRSYKASAANYLSQDYFTYTLARMLGPDYFHYLLPFGIQADRGRALEHGLEASSLDTNAAYYRVPFADAISSFPAMAGSKPLLPILFVNTTRMQDGNPGVVTNLKLDAEIFDGRVDVLSLLKPNTDISLASGAVLGGRFPYLSPGGRIDTQYFVDGGYFDNSGAGVVQELMQGMVDIVKKDTSLWKQFSRLHFHVLHIINSPVGGGGAPIFTPVMPIKNDLFSPVDAILGAYDMQTTVNDSRLRNFIQDLDAYSGIKADYQRISLYMRASEYLPGEERPEDSYPMNWFMSDTIRQRIWDRLGTEPVLKQMLH